MNKQQAIQEKEVIKLSIEKYERKISELDAIINKEEVFPPDGEWMLNPKGYISHIPMGDTSEEGKQGTVFQSKEHAELAATYVKHHLMMFHLWLKVTGGEQGLYDGNCTPYEPSNIDDDTEWWVSARDNNSTLPTYTKDQCVEACRLLNDGILE